MPFADRKRALARASICPLAALAVTAAVSGCAPRGGSGASVRGEASTAARSHLGVSANREGQLRYEPSMLLAKAGRVTITFSNFSPAAHNLTLALPKGAPVAATATFQHARKALSVRLKPGRYAFFCTVPGHREAGMQGTLIVR